MQERIGSLRGRDNADAVRFVADQARLATAIAERTTQLTTDHEAGWEDVWKDGMYDPEWVTRTGRPPGWIPPSAGEGTDETPLDA